MYIMFTNFHLVFWSLLLLCVYVWLLLDEQHVVQMYVFVGLVHVRHEGFVQHRG